MFGITTRFTWDSIVCLLEVSKWCSFQSHSFSAHTESSRIYYFYQSVCCAACRRLCCSKSIKSTLPSSIQTSWKALHENSCGGGKHSFRSSWSCGVGLVQAIQAIWAIWASVGLFFCFRFCFCMCQWFTGKGTYNFCRGCNSFWKTSIIIQAGSACD